MSDRYFGKVIRVINSYELILNKGSADGVENGMKFLIIGLGEVVSDPDTGEEIERLEIVRGHVVVTHVQEKICTTRSNMIDKSANVKEIKKVTSRGSMGIFGNQDTITESITPGPDVLKGLTGAAVGDLALKR